MINVWMLAIAALIKVFSCYLQYLIKVVFICWMNLLLSHWEANSELTFYNVESWNQEKDKKIRQLPLKYSINPMINELSLNLPNYEHESKEDWIIPVQSVTL